MSTIVSERVHFALFPAGDEETASSRIRIYSFARSLSEKWRIPSSFGYDPKANVFFVQKKTDARILFWAAYARLRGYPLIYDVDDLGAALRYWVSPGYLRRMLSLADIVTTASDAQSQVLRQEYHVDNPVAMPACVDYYPSGPAKLSTLVSGKLRILWFGSGSNIKLLLPYIDTLSSIPDSELIVCADQRTITAYSRFSDRIQFIPWSLSTFIRTLQSCHLSCLMHDGSAADRAKGNNKMITSITWGVPAIVSRTLEYERTAIEAGVEYAIFSSRGELVEAHPEVASCLSEDRSRRPHRQRPQVAARAETPWS
jgi:hypothetical protein